MSQPALLKNTKIKSEYLLVFKLQEQRTVTMTFGENDIAREVYEEIRTRGTIGRWAVKDSRFEERLKDNKNENSKSKMD